MSQKIFYQNLIESFLNQNKDGDWKSVYQFCKHFFGNMAGEAEENFDWPYPLEDTDEFYTHENCRLVFKRLAELIFESAFCSILGEEAFNLFSENGGIETFKKFIEGLTPYEIIEWMNLVIYLKTKMYKSKDVQIILENI